MKNIARIIVVPILLALINVGLSRLWYINLIWIFTLVFFFTDNENYAITFSIIGGFFFDLFMHNNIGVTSLSILLAIIVYLGFRMLFSGEGLLYQAFSVILVLSFTLSIQSGLDVLVEGVRYNSLWDFLYWWRYLISHSILVGLFITILGGIGGMVGSSKRIKLN